MKKILVLIVALLFAFSITGAFAADKAADTKAAPAPAKDEKKAEPKKIAEKKHQLTGEVKAVDAKAATVTVKGKKEMTFTADEKLLKDIKIGDKIVVTYTEKDGKATATAIKAPKAKGEKKAENRPGSADDGNHALSRGAVEEEGHDPCPDPAHEVENKEFRAPHVPLDLDAEEKKREHVEEDVRPRGVHEHVGEHLPPGARLQDVVRNQVEVDQAPAAVHVSEEEHEDAGSDDDDRGVEIAIPERTPQGADHDFKVRRVPG
jgi:microtubule-associated protein 1